MSLRTKSRMPASTSETAARSLSTSGVSSTCSGRMVAFIGNSSVSISDERGRPPHDEVECSHLPCRFWPHLGQSAAMVDHSRAIALLGRKIEPNRDDSGVLPAAFEARAEARAGGARRRFADRARDGDALEQLLLGADLAQPL